MQRAGAVTVLGPESRDKEARMRAMVDAAVELFAVEGYSAVSTRRIADAAGCSETLLFRYFGGKRGLLLAICQDLGVIEDSVTPPRPADFQDLADYLESYLLWLFGLLNEQSARLKVVVSAMVGDDEVSSAMESMHDGAVAHVAAELAQFQDRGLIAPGIDLMSVAAAIEQSAYGIGLFSQNVYGKPHKELAAIARAFARALAHGLGAGEDEPVADSWRREAIQAAHDATQDLNRIVTLLKAGDAAVTPKPAGGGRRRNGAKAK